MWMHKVLYNSKSFPIYSETAAESPGVNCKRWGEDDGEKETQGKMDLFLNLVEHDTVVQTC